MVAGELADGGSGYDVLIIAGDGPVDISQMVLTDIDQIYNDLSNRTTAYVTTTQVETIGSMHGYYTLTNGGALSLASFVNGIMVLTLSAAGNTVDMDFIGGEVHVLGGAGNDVIFGSEHSLSTTGYGGDDRLVGGPGSQLSGR